MTAKPVARSWLVYMAAGGFIAGMVVMAALFTVFPAGPLATVESATEAASRPAASTVTEVRPTAKEEAPAVSPPAQTVAVPAMSANPFEVLRNRRLDMPVKGAKREDLRDSFDEQRGSSRRHEAIDLLAPRHTPVVAVEDGTIDPYTVLR